MRDILEAVRTWKNRRLDYGLALLVNAQHSSPRMPGARMVVSEEGETVGSVSMGCVENDLREHVLQVMREGQPRVVHYGIADEAAIEVGLSCGGEIDVLVLPSRSVDMGLDRLMQAGPDDAWVLVTGISEDVLGAQVLIDASGKQVGHFAGDDQRQACVAAATEMMRCGGTRRLQLPNTETRFFIEAFVPPPNLAIVGATPLAAALSQVAVFAGFQSWIVDPRRAVGVEARFPHARKIEFKWPEEAFEALGVDAQWYVAVLSHDAKLDVPALCAALKANCFYIGLLGSARTQEQRRQAVREAGFSEEAITAIHGPIGLCIHSKTLEEIAVSIVAEMIQQRHAPSA
ncbi:MAG: XdhC family protein [Spartobacteria bacterium]|nr:XdhC family protein [Spartobacteria bacterium]